MRATGLEETDERIIAILRQDGRISIRALSEDLGLPETTTRDRLHRLERDGYIEGYGVVLDPKRMGFPLMAWLIVGGKQDTVEELGERLARDPLVLAIHPLPDSPTRFALNVVAASTEQLTHTVNRWRSEMDVVLEDLFLLDPIEMRPVSLEQWERERSILEILKGSTA